MDTSQKTVIAIAREALPEILNDNPDTSAKVQAAELLLRYSEIQEKDLVPRKLLQDRELKQLQGEANSYLMGVEEGKRLVKEEEK